MNRFVAFVFLGLTIASGALPARADPGEFWSDDSKLTTEADDVRIADWWRDSGLPAGEAERRTFDLILERRLEQVPKSVARAVREDRRVRVYFEAIGSGVSDGSYSGLTRRTKIKLPPELRESSSYYATLMHELEHAIQRHSQGLAKNLAHQAFDWRGRHRILAETEAMEAEWNYLRAIPEADRLRIAEELAASPYAPMLAVDIDNHRFAGRSLEGYLEYQWQTGRNNPQTIERKAREETRSLCRRLLVVGAAFGAVDVYCQVLHAKRRERANAGEAPIFYRYYCRGVRKTGMIPDRNRP